MPLSGVGGGGVKGVRLRRGDGGVLQSSMRIATKMLRGGWGVGGDVVLKIGQISMSLYLISHNTMS